MVKRFWALTFVLLFVAALGFRAVVSVDKTFADIPGEISYSATNTELFGDDEVTSTPNEEGDSEVNTPGPVDIGFTFNFYGTNYTTADINTNGVLMFNEQNSAYSNTDLPTSTYGPAVMAFWDDLITDNFSARSIYYKTVGSPGSRKFIVQWTNMSFCCSVGVPMGTFQAILYEGSNKIQLQYRDLVDNTRAQGDSATIGLNKDSETANKYSYGTAVLNAPMAISYTPDGDGGYTSDGTIATYDPVFLYVDGLPGTATLTSPADSATNVSLNPELVWSSASLTTSYRVIVSTNSDMTGPDVNVGDLTATSYLDTDTPLEPDTVYYWRVVTTNDQGSEYSAIHSFTTTSEPNNAPDDVGSVGPSELLSGNTIDPTQLLDTPFTFDLSDTDSGDQVRYEVALSTDGDPGDAVIRYLSPLGDQGLRSFTYGQPESGGAYTVGSNHTQLTDGNSYYISIRAIDEHGAASDWYDNGDPAFTYNATPGDDNDGTTTSVEDSAPNSGDANNDGFPDSWQANVSSLVDPVTSHYVTLETTGCTSNSAVGTTAESALGAHDNSFSYPAGLLHFTITCATSGATATVTQYYYGVNPAGMILRKYNNATKTYTTVSGATISSVIIGGQQAAKVVYHITDGGALDEDGTANGVIVDPVGLAASGSLTDTGVNILLSSALAGFLVTAAFIVQRRQIVSRG
ncbi:MAG TPA: choice-of-anchor U domain-containing protein [Candidatus Saccharimonadales bacterium]|nr:choice-of-anchor U domain-containing protein [Candidatus Saccharimonadales bacterium]